MSHELRTPLNVILLTTQIMGRGTHPTPQDQEHLALISRNSNHLLNMINDVLDLFKIGRC
jgi:signal transduction histidine kinase